MAALPSSNSPSIAEWPMVEDSARVCRPRTGIFQYFLKAQSPLIGLIDCILVPATLVQNLYGNELSRRMLVLLDLPLRSVPGPKSMRRAVNAASNVQGSISLLMGLRVWKPSVSGTFPCTGSRNERIKIACARNKRCLHMNCGRKQEMAGLASQLYSNQRDPMRWS